MLNRDRKGVKDIEDLLNHLIRRERTIRIRAQPAFKNRAAGELEELALDTFLAQ